MICCHHQRHWRTPIDDLNLIISVKIHWHAAIVSSMLVNDVFVRPDMHRPTLPCIAEDFHIARVPSEHLPTVHSHSLLLAHRHTLVIVAVSFVHHQR